MFFIILRTICNLAFISAISTIISINFIRVFAINIIIATADAVIIIIKYRYVFIIIILFIVFIAIIYVNFLIIIIIINFGIIITILTSAATPIQLFHPTFRFNNNILFQFYALI